MTETILITPDVPYENIRRIAAAVCLRAIEQTRDSDPLKALDACMWLLSPDFPFWAEAADLPFADSIALLTSGKARKAKTKLKG